MVKVVDEFAYDGYQKVIADLMALPEVKAIEPVRGWCNLLVQVETPTRAIKVAHKIMLLKWVKHLEILTAEPVQDKRQLRPPHDVPQKLEVTIDRDS